MTRPNKPVLIVRQPKAFIANAPTDLATLLAENDALQARVETLERALGTIGANEDGSIWIQWPTLLMLLDAGEIGYAVRDSADEQWRSGKSNPRLKPKESAEEMMEALRRALKAPTP